jgi:DNA repair protein RadC
MIYQIISERKLKRKVKVVNPEEVYKVVKRYAEADREQFILLTLNGEHNIISVSIVSIGTVNKTIVHPREIYCRAISERASAIIVCHNHPSGSLEPSGEDKQVTVQIFDAGKIIGIPLIDHIVFTKTGFTSLRQYGVFPDGN